MAPRKGGVLAFQGIPRISNNFYSILDILGFPLKLVLDFDLILVCFDFDLILNLI